MKNITNKITEVYDNIPDETLENIIYELYHFEKKGFMDMETDFRTLINTIRGITGQDYSEVMLVVQMCVLKEFAFRKLNLKDKD